QNIGSWFDGEVAAGIAFVEHDIGGFDGEDSAFRHGVAGVDHQVHEDLLDLAGVGADGAKVGGQHQAEIDVFADEAPEHAAQAGDELVEIEHAGLQDLAAAEGEELRGQGGGPFAGLHNLFDGMAVRVLRAEIVEDELAVAGDDGEEIIEVV